MELFTLGIGHYMETDVKEAARALTGWTVVEGKFRVLEVLRGQAPPDGTVWASLVCTPCPDADGPAPSLMPGRDYIVFLGQDNLVAKCQV